MSKLLVIFLCFLVVVNSFFIFRLSSLNNYIQIVSSVPWLEVTITDKSKLEKLIKEIYLDESALYFFDQTKIYQKEKITNIIVQFTEKILPFEQMIDSNIKKVTHSSELTFNPNTHKVIFKLQVYKPYFQKYRIQDIEDFYSHHIIDRLFRLKNKTKVQSEQFVKNNSFKFTHFIVQNEQTP